MNKKILILLIFVLMNTSIFAQLDESYKPFKLKNGKNIVCPNSNFCFLVLVQENQIIGIKKNNLTFQQATSEEAVDIVNAHTPEFQANEIVLLSINTVSSSAETDPMETKQEITVKFEEQPQLWKYQNLGIILRVGKDEAEQSILIYQLLRI